MLLALVRWPISNPSVQKWVFEPRPFGTTFAVVSAKIPRISKTRFWGKPGAPKKRTKWGGARQDKYIWPFFEVPGFGPFHWFFGTANARNPFSPQFWACPPATDKRKPQTRLNWGCRWKCHSLDFLLEDASFSASWPGATLHIREARCTNCCPAETTKHYENRDFPPSDAARPILNAWPGAFSNALGEKKHPIIETQTAYIYIYIYIYAVELITWPSKVNNLAICFFVVFSCFSKIFFFLQGEWDFFEKKF